MNYQQLDSFVSTDTWHSRHPTDIARFFKILHGLVKDPRFNADQMREHMAQQVGAANRDDDHPYNTALDHYAAAAWAVREYLEANNL